MVSKKKRNRQSYEPFVDRGDLAMPLLVSAPISDYERGLRRGMAIAREHEGYHDAEPAYDAEPTVAWGDAEAAMEREIEEAKR